MRAHHRIGSGSRKTSDGTDMAPEFLRIPLRQKSPQSMANLAEEHNHGMAPARLPAQN